MIVSLLRQCVAVFCFLCCFQSLSVASSELEPSPSDALTPLNIGTFSFLAEVDTGFAIPLIEQALAEHGYRIELQYLPGKRVMAELNNGVLDGDLIRSIDLSRGFQNVVRVDEPIIHACGLLYRLEQTPVRLSNLSLRPQVGIYAGSAGAVMRLLQRWPNAAPVTYDSLKQGVKMLEHQRLEYVAIPDLQEVLLKQMVDSPIVLEDVFELEPAYMHLHKRHQTLAEGLAITLRRLKQETPLDACRVDTWQLDR